MHEGHAASHLTVPDIIAPRPPSSLNAAIVQLDRVRRQFGSRASLASLCDRVAKRLMHFQVDHVLCFDVDRLPEPPPADTGLEFRFLTPDEIRTFAADPANQLDQSMADRAAARYDQCLGVLAGDRLAGYGWCAFDSIEPEHGGGVAMSWPRHVAYMYNGFTRPEFRGRRLNGLRVLWAAKELAARGIQKLVALVEWTNWASLRSSLDAGGTSLGRLVTFGIGRRRWSYFPKAAQEMGIQFGPHARPRSHDQELPVAASEELAVAPAEALARFS